MGLLSEPLPDLNDWRLQPETLDVVRQERRVVQGATLSKLSDTSWSLAPLGKSPSDHRRTLRFGDVPPRFVRVTKEVCYLAINEPTPPALYLRAGSNTRRYLSGPSIELFLNDWKRFLHFIEDQDFPPLTLNELPDELFTKYLGYLKNLHGQAGARRGRPLRKETKAARLFAVERVHAYAEYLDPVDRISRPTWLEVSHPPFAGTSYGTGTATVEIPEDVLFPLIFWAKTFIHDLAPDIQCARERRRDLAACSPPKSKSYGAGAQAARAFLGEWTTSHGCLPGFRVRSSGTVSLAVDYLVRIASPECHPATLADIARKEFSHVPTVDSAPMDTAIDGRVAGTRWTEAIDFYDVEKLVNDLRTACLVVMLLGTGLRGQEALTLQSPNGCLVEEIDLPDGRRRYRVHGRLYKGVRGSEDSQNLEGVPEFWETNEFGAQAARLAVELASGNFVFSSDEQGLGSADTAMSTSRLNTRIRRFISRCNAMVDDHPQWRHLRIPQDAAPTSRQFRRTVLSQIQDAPEGIYAAALQAKHAMGPSLILQQSGAYGDLGRTAGDVRSARDDDAAKATIELADQLVRGGSISGDSVRRALEIVEGAGGALMRLGSKAEAERSARRNKSQIFRSDKALGWCVFDPAKALCVKADLPDLGNCQMACTNLVHSDDDVHRMRSAATQLHEDAQNAPEPLALRLIQLKDSYEKAAEAHEEAAISSRFRNEEKSYGQPEHHAISHGASATTTPQEDE